MCVMVDSLNCCPNVAYYWCMCLLPRCKLVSENGELLFSVLLKIRCIVTQSLVRCSTAVCQRRRRLCDIFSAVLQLFICRWRHQSSVSESHHMSRCRLLIRSPENSLQLEGLSRAHTSPTDLDL